MLTHHPGLFGLEIHFKNTSIGEASVDLLSIWPKIQTYSSMMDCVCDTVLVRWRRSWNRHHNCRPNYQWWNCRIVWLPPTWHKQTSNCWEWVATISLEYYRWAWEHSDSLEPINIVVFSGTKFIDDCWLVLLLLLEFVDCELLYPPLYGFPCIIILVIFVFLSGNLVWCVICLNEICGILLFQNNSRVPCSFSFLRVS